MRRGGKRAPLAIYLDRPRYEIPSGAPEGIGSTIVGLCTRRSIPELEHLHRAVAEEIQAVVVLAVEEEPVRARSGRMWAGSGEVCPKQTLGASRPRSRRYFGFSLAAKPAGFYNANSVLSGTFASSAGRER